MRYLPRLLSQNLNRSTLSCPFKWLCTRFSFHPWTNIVCFEKHESCGHTVRTPNEEQIINFNSINVKTRFWTPETSTIFPLCSGYFLVYSHISLLSKLVSVSLSECIMNSAKPLTFWCFIQLWGSKTSFLGPYFSTIAFIAKTFLSIWRLV